MRGFTYLLVDKQLQVAEMEFVNQCKLKRFHDHQQHACNLSDRAFIACSIAIAISTHDGSHLSYG